MEVDPMEAAKANEEDDADAEKDRRKSRLNNYVAITVALLATFMGVCKVKDDNIVQAMQQAQAKSVDAWSWYQAKKIRVQIAQATADQLEIQALTVSSPIRAAIEQKKAIYKEQAQKQISESADVEKQARGYDKDYDLLNYHDDQFDLSDTLLALAISLLALTSLTQMRWLFATAMVPTFFGVLMGLAGLFGWHIHPDALTRLLS